MTVSLVDSRICRQTVEVAVAICVPHPHTLPADQNDIQWFVVVCAELLFQADIILFLHWSPSFRSDHLS